MGFATTFVYTWQHLVDGFLVTTEQIGDLLVDLCRIAPERVHVAPNGVDMDRFFNIPLIGSGRRSRTGAVSIVMASRIDKDKRDQVRALKLLINGLRQARMLTEVVEILGDGPDRLEFEGELERFIKDLPNVDVKMRGWVPADVVPRIMNRAVFSVSAGRGAMGRPCGRNPVCSRWRVRVELPDFKLAPTST